MKYDLFISYSRKDKQIVDQFVRALNNAGFRVWIDLKGISSGEEFTRIIPKAIKNSTLVIFFSSINSNASKWTVKEIGYALKKEKTILPVQLDDTKYDVSIDFLLTNIDSIKYQDQEPSLTIEHLINTIETHIGIPIRHSEPTLPNNNDKESQASLTIERLFSSASKYLSTAKLPDASISRQKSKYINKLYSLGLSCTERGEQELAAAYYKKAAEEGDAKAQNNLGLCYEYGQGVIQSNKEAVRWYRKAAEQGYTNAQNNLGLCYEYGLSVEQDEQEAVIWFRIAAEQGNATAQYNLGKHYDDGRCVKQDFKEAVKWYMKAAEQGHADAQYLLAMRYFQGLGVTQDYREAVKWFLRAAEQGHTRAQYELSLCYLYGQGVPQDQNGYEKWQSKRTEYDAWSYDPENIWQCDSKGLDQDFQNAIINRAKNWYLLHNSNNDIM